MLLLLVILTNLFFFFKQKTVYEMRISDWSSDVCSSDLFWSSRTVKSTRFITALATRLPVISRAVCWRCCRAVIRHRRCGRRPDRRKRAKPLEFRTQIATIRPLSAALGPAEDCRSEEHTSELQSLMRISYAVFCLKKKTNT